MKTASVDNSLSSRISPVADLLDEFFSKPGPYTVMALICLKPRTLVGIDTWLESFFHVSNYPLFRMTTYFILLLVLICYMVRLVSKQIKRVNYTLLCITGLFAFLSLITYIFDGASGYHIDWHAGFALMLMIDMGLQRERKSIVCALTGALEIWVYLNALTLMFYSNFSILGVSSTEGILGNHVFYYRIVFPALAMTLVRYHMQKGKGKWRTVLTLFICVGTIIYQQGGTALIGVAVFVALLIWCNRRALPRYITPLTATLFAFLVFIGIQYFGLLNLFKDLITKGLGKSMTLTNRTLIWAKALELIFNNPITGVGYLPVAYTHELFGEVASHMHNQLLELMLHGGLISIALYLAMVYFSSKEAILYRRSAAVKIVALLLCTFSVMGVAEIFHNDPIYYALFVFLSRADCLIDDVKHLPRISLLKRIKRDIEKKR